MSKRIRCVLLLLFLGITGSIRFPAAARSLPDAADWEPWSAGDAWTFVSMPDFVNRDVPWPEPKLDSILGFVLDAVKAENPDFVLVPGDMVNGRWWLPDDITLTKDFVYDPAIPDDSTLALRRQHLRAMARRYHTGWIERMKAHGLPFYVAVGDHEIGDNPWIGLKKLLVCDFEDSFREYYRMPLNGPPGRQGLSYSFIHRNCLFIVLDPFEQDQHGDVQVRVSQEQLHWMERVLRDAGAAALFRFVACHTPVLTSGIQATASSRITLPGETQSPLWQLMRRYDVDLYLCGEFHAVSCQESDGILQIVHGALMGFSQSLNYLVVTITPGAVQLEIKTIETVLEKPDGEPDRLSRIACISDRQLRMTATGIGSMRLLKTNNGKLFSDRTGIFTERYVRYGEIDTVPVR